MHPRTIKKNSDRPSSFSEFFLFFLPKTKNATGATQAPVALRLSYILY